MRRNSASTVTIARALGGISAKSVGRKLRQLGLDGNYKWPDEKIDLLRQGYSAGLSPSQIARKLGTGYSSKSITTKASELGISRRTDWTEKDERLFDYLHSIGLPQKDILHHMSDYPDGQVRHRIGRKREEFSPLNFDRRLSLRIQLNETVEQILGDDQEDFGARAAAWIAACSPDTGRDLREISMVCVLPIIFIERVFARLDIQRIWPVTETTSSHLGPDAYQEIAAICNEEKDLLSGMEGMLGGPENRP